MIISIPIRFFVPVECVDGNLLDLNMEDIDYREPIKCKVKANDKDKVKDKKKDKGKIYVEIDDEYVNAMTKATAIDNGTQKTINKTLGTKDNENVQKVKRE